VKEGEREGGREGEFVVLLVGIYIALYGGRRNQVDEEKEGVREGGRAPAD